MKQKRDTTTDCLSHKMKNLINESLFFQKNNSNYECFYETRKRETTTDSHCRLI